MAHAYLSTLIGPTGVAALISSVCNKKVVADVFQLIAGLVTRPGFIPHLMAETTSRMCR